MKIEDPSTTHCYFHLDANNSNEPTIRNSELAFHEPANHESKLDRS